MFSSVSDDDCRYVDVVRDDLRHEARKLLRQNTKNGGCARPRGKETL